MKICILTNLKRYQRTFNILYPIYKWRQELRKAGVNIDIIYHHHDKKIQKADKVIILNRYFEERESGNSSAPHLDSPAIHYIVELKNLGKEVIWFDVYDGTGTPDFRVIKYVDQFWKKQVFKDLSLYTLNRKDKSVRIWLDRIPEKSQYPDYYPCPEDQLHKIRVAWNIGLCDYRVFPRHLQYLRNYYHSPLVSFSEEAKTIDTSFRGKIKYDSDDHVSKQREKLLKTIKHLEKNRIKTGPPIKYQDYLKELSKSKIIVSPFGWGEICYRDFETFLVGSLLLKPSMNHINTFPNYFIDGTTYLSIDWKLENFLDTFLSALDNYSKYKIIASEGRNLFFKYSNNPKHFVEKFLSIIETVNTFEKAQFTK